MLQIRYGFLNKWTVDWLSNRIHFLKAFHAVPSCRRRVGWIRGSRLLWHWSRCLWHLWCDSVNVIIDIHLGENIFDSQGENFDWFLHQDCCLWFSFGGICWHNVVQTTCSGRISVHLGSSAGTRTVLLHHPHAGGNSCIPQYLLHGCVPIHCIYSYSWVSYCMPLWGCWGTFTPP